MIRKTEFLNSKKNIIQALQNNDFKIDKKIISLTVVESPTR